MIVKVAAQGRGMRGLVNYMLGPGRAEEHSDQRVVAMSGDLADIGTGVVLGDEARRSLGMQLGLYPELFPESCPERGGVYHVVFSAAPGEHVADEEWARIAADTAKVLHLERPDGATASWAAFAHGTSANGLEHMHFVAGLVRSDGSEVKTYLRNGYAALHDVARQAEARCGLAVVAGRDHGSLPVVTRPEREACARRGRPEPERDVLARTVRSVAAAVSTEAEFPDELRAAGVLVRPRYATGSRGEVVGYSVAVRPVGPAPRGRAGATAPAAGEAKPIWFGGGRLGRDLTLPALRSRWEHAQGDTPGAGPAEVRQAAVARWAGRRQRADFSVEAAMRTSARQQPGGRAWDRAADRLAALNDVAARPGRLGGAQWRALAWEASGATAGLARRIEINGPGPLADASRNLARAAVRPPAQPVDDATADRRRRMRGVASVCSAHRLGASGQHAQGWLRVMQELARLADTMARAADARRELAFEAGLARAAAAELQAAHGQLSAQRPDHLSQPHPAVPENVPVAVLEQGGPAAGQARTVEIGPAGPDLAGQPVAEPERPADTGLDR